MAEIPESLLRRSAEAKAKALGVPVEQVLAEMKGEGPPVEAPQADPAPDVEAAPEAPIDADQEVAPDEPAAVEPAPVDEPAPEVEESEEAPAAVATKTEDEAPAQSPQRGR